MANAVEKKWSRTEVGKEHWGPSIAILNGPDRAELLERMACEGKVEAGEKVSHALRASP